MLYVRSCELCKQASQSTGCVPKAACVCNYKAHTSRMSEQEQHGKRGAAGGTKQWM